MNMVDNIYRLMILNSIISFQQKKYYRSIKLIDAIFLNFHFF